MFDVFPPDASLNNIKNLCLSPCMSLFSLVSRYVSIFLGTVMPYMMKHTDLEYG